MCEDEKRNMLNETIQSHRYLEDAFNFSMAIFYQERIEELENNERIVLQHFFLILTISLLDFS